ncbi:monosaccharide ABC transporter ATP-binding protein (CUT2 family) [Kushneria sinocarnis]|uniref:Monosaccharide ABC transporter ATP-binding protein (CUT2 family) n=1 Tax=Kushneria sinocarnis TaxID=595502 RepID=A0A420WZT0_9GAMM|nr:ATP-binding cassette domain-containing protein [Kushneria sinocarnis]RKR06784.1 monosaccharide ABC transporter ATP-binding protein (CUT2 family) [Kushneria sinocarnis]
MTAATSSAGEEILRGENLSKSFGQVTALSDVSFRLKKGEVLALLGDNGAGKSTLMKILTGFHRPTSGSLYFDNQPVEFGSVTHARRAGIEPVYQDLALINELSVFRNMFLKREILRGGPLRLLNDAAMREKADAQLREIGIKLPSVDVPISKLSGGQRQAIAVARSVYSENVRVLLLDEPTAAMGVRESKQILDLIRRLKETSELAVIIVAHNYAQIFDVCDRINLLQYGTITFDRATADTSIQELTDIVVNSYRNADQTTPA